MQISTTNFNLNNLLPETRYQALVCRRNVNITTDLPPPPSEPHVPECGHCFACFQTDRQRFTFERTVVSRVDDVFLNLTCQVESNGPFRISWTVMSLDSNNPRRMRLENGDRFDGERVRVENRTMEGRNGMEVVVTSSIIAADEILEQNVECLAESSSEMQRSQPEAFEEITDEDPTLLPIWAIALIAILLILFINIGVVCVVACVVYRRKRNRKYKEVTQLSQLR